MRYKITDMKKINILLLLFIGFLTFSCSEDDLKDSIIKDPVKVSSEVDDWISEKMTSPFNIEVIYKWDDEETDLAKNLVPPFQDTVIPFLNVLKTLWIDTYVEQAGEDFVKELSPKQILLVGSKNFNADGTITEGTAEGGRKIVLYGLNHFDPHGEESIKHMIHVVHHEFAHIMHQTKDFGIEYGKITPEGYTSTWFNTPTKKAREAGFITAYSQKSTHEDFVDMIATFLTNTNEEWEAILAEIENPKGVEAIRKKEAIIADYFMQSWGINFYDFQNLVSSEITRLVESE